MGFAWRRAMAGAPAKAADAEDAIGAEDDAIGAAKECGWCGAIAREEGLEGAAPNVPAAAAAALGGLPLGLVAGGGASDLWLGPG